MEDYLIKRDNKTESIISTTINDTIISDLRWISVNEYEITSRQKNKWLKENSTRVKITNNEPEYYECYIKYEKYAAYSKIYK